MPARQPDLTSIGPPFPPVSVTGFFVTFEGTEGSGKSTQLRLLAESLRAEGVRVRELREPGGCAVAEEIRRLLKHSPAAGGMTAKAELLLLSAARAQLVREVIRPALAAGEFVLCDRFFDSSVAYQGWGRGLDLDRVHELIEFAVGTTRPDLTLVFAVPRAVSLARQHARSAAGAGPQDRFEKAGDEFFARVEEGYRAVAAREPARVRWMDGTPTIEEVRREVTTLVRAAWQQKRAQFGVR